MLTRNLRFYLFVFATFLAYFVGLGTLPLLGPDEPRYAQVAREMFLRNDWVTPTLGGFNWFEKPALLYWLQISSYYIFGVNEFAARFGSAVFGLLTIAVICLFSVSNFQPTIAEKNDENPKSKIQNPKSRLFWALLTSAACLGLLVFAHAATFDIILTFPIAAALYCFSAAEIHNIKNNRLKLEFTIAFYFFVGLALLAKGLIGIVLPFGIIFFYFVLIRKFPTKIFVYNSLWGVFVSLAVAATWYVPMFWRHGWRFIDEFFVQHHFARYTSNKYAHPEPFYYFWLMILALTLPWVLFLFGALWNILKTQTERLKTHGKEVLGSPDLKPPVQKNFVFFVLSWLFVPLVFFSFSGSKLPGYILPSLPAALILTARQIDLFVQNNRWRSLLVQCTAAVILLGVPLSLQTFAVNFARQDTTKFLLEEAAAQNYSKEKVLNLHDISHSLEFYAANRLVRGENGRQLKFEGTSEILQYMKQANEKKVLVLVPLEHEHQLYKNNAWEAAKISDNNAFALVACALIE